MDVGIALALFAAAWVGMLSIIPGIIRGQGSIVAISCVSLCAIAIVLSLLAPPPSPATKAAIAVATVAAATIAGWPVTTYVLHLALNISTAEPTASLPASGWVGLVERFGFALALVLGLPEVAALIVGVKALGTYSAPTHAENTTPATRVLGTLTSVGWALLASTAYLALAI